MPGIGNIAGWAFDEARFMHGGPGPGHITASEYHDTRPATKITSDLDFNVATLQPYLIAVFAALGVDEGWLCLHFEAVRAQVKPARIKTALGDAIACILRHRCPGRHDHGNLLYHLVAGTWRTFLQWELSLAVPPVLGAPARSTMTIARPNTFNLAELQIVRLHLREWLRFTDLASHAAARTWILSIGVFFHGDDERKRFNGAERLLLVSLGLRLNWLWHCDKGNVQVATISQLSLALQKGIIDNTILPQAQAFPSREIRMEASSSLATHSRARENLLAQYRIVLGKGTATFEDLHAEFERLRHEAKQVDKHVLVKIAYALCPLSNASERDAAVQGFMAWSLGQAVKAKTVMYSWTKKEDLWLLKLAIELGFEQIESIALAIATVVPINPSSKACLKRLTTLGDMPGVPALCCLEETIPVWWEAMGLDEQRDRDTDDKLGRMLERMDHGDNRVIGTSDYSTIDDDLSQGDLDASSIYPNTPITDQVTLIAYMAQPFRQNITFGIADQDLRTILAVQTRAYDRLAA